MIRLRNAYNEYFRDQCGGKNFQQWLKELEDSDMTTEDYLAMLEYIGVNPDDFDDIDYESTGRSLLSEHWAIPSI